MKKFFTAASVLLAIALLPQSVLGQKRRTLQPKQPSVLQSDCVQQTPLIRKLVSHAIPADSQLADPTAVFNQFRQIIANNDKEALAALLERGVDPNLREVSSGMTPLMVATVTGARFSIIRLLLAKGADKDIQDNLGKTAADYAQIRAQATIAILNRESETEVVTADNGTEDNSLAQHQPDTEKTMSVSKAYQILGVLPTDSTDKIKEAFREAHLGWLQKVNPDNSSSVKTLSKTLIDEEQQIYEAYQAIMESRM